MKTSFGAAWALRQIRELIKLGVEVHVSLPDGGPLVGSYEKVGAVEHLLQTDFPIRSPWTFLPLARNLRLLVDKVEPDIIHSHFVGTTLTMRLALGRNHHIPRVFQVPGPLHLEHPFFRKAEIATAGPQDNWIGSCQWTCERYRLSGVDSNKIFLSYYGTDIDSYTQKLPGKIRKELGLSEECKVVGLVAYMYAPKRYLGQSRGLKGHEDLIDAIKICLGQFPDLHCIIVGGAWSNANNYEHALRRYALQHCGNRVIFLGTRHDVPDIYSDINVAVHPSHSENVGGAVESCLLGVPTITTNVGGFPDLIQDGITGWLVPPKQPKALAVAITEALKDEAEAQKRALSGQIFAHDLFDVRKTAAGIKSIYEKIVTDKSTQSARLI